MMQTPIDHPLEIAGIGARSWAFIIDWHFRFFAAALWFIATLYLQGGNLSGLESMAFVPTTFFPPLMIYFLYHPVLEILFHGQSPGKRIVGIRVARTDGEQPSAWQILLRNLLRFVDCFPFCYSLGLLVGLCTDKQIRVGDKVAGTVLVYLP